MTSIWRLGRDSARACGLSLWSTNFHLIPRNAIGGASVMPGNGCTQQWARGFNAPLLVKHFAHTVNAEASKESADGILERELVHGESSQEQAWHIWQNEPNEHLLSGVGGHSRSRTKGLVKIVDTPVHLWAAGPLCAVSVNAIPFLSSRFMQKGQFISYLSVRRTPNIVSAVVKAQTPVRCFATSSLASSYAPRAETRRQLELGLPWGIHKVACSSQNIIRMDQTIGRLGVACSQPLIKPLVQTSDKALLNPAKSHNTLDGVFASSQFPSIARAREYGQNAPHDDARLQLGKPTSLKFSREGGSGRGGGRAGLQRRIVAEPICLTNGSKRSVSHVLRRDGRKALMAGPRESAKLLEQEKLRPERGVHVFQCDDQLGVVARISEVVASRGANMLSVDLHIDFEADKPQFYSRCEFSFALQQWPPHVMEDDFAALRDRFSAVKSYVKVAGRDPHPKVALLASWQDHCLVDLLYQWQEGHLPAEITCVISNHERDETTHVGRFLQRHGIPCHFFPTSKTDKKEKEILNVVKETTDFLVLARYMQILSPSFLHEYGKDIINIHHGLLPSFKGANPYAQAYRSGVKLIGATSHFVTEELDMGPIIEQLVDRVSHRDSLAAFASKSEMLEKQCLALAVQHYGEHRLLRYSGNKIIVFN
eukprot:TRINITY_DN10485_c0_g1_i3.p1 TRINITY_DN10485_c0_g1~~TRINITY_DN10485_c0_g1_i3.p1  ORF type:complete len:652 (-),score=64.47 TRINITY_DN10485_c0_g1_i3:262-2217(-)